MAISGNTYEAGSARNNSALTTNVCTSTQGRTIDIGRASASSQATMTRSAHANDRGSAYTMIMGDKVAIIRRPIWKALEPARREPGVGTYSAGPNAANDTSQTHDGVVDIAPPRPAISRIFGAPTTNQLRRAMRRA